ncbi:hypothetical protein AB0942_33415 [Streptomyces nodosus]|uniref:hypothetical protein n=1 Tax=Streptomyces nodosus TaxID=40318 RepID=UPI003455062A
MNRYEIREQEATDLQKAMGFPATFFIVWDLEHDKRVPFGSYVDREAAQRRIQRMEERA